MNDLINRKGAINAVCTVLYPDADKMNDAKKVLKEMPSAQPDWNEMMVVRDCCSVLCDCRGVLCDCCDHAIHVKRIDAERREG